MIRLSNRVPQSLQLITTQNGADVSVSYADNNAAQSGGTQNSLITSATTTTICVTPPLLNQTYEVVRSIDSLSVLNTFNGAHTVTVQMAEGVVKYPLISTVLQAGDMLGYSDNTGFYVQDSSGNRKTATSQYATINPSSIWTTFRNRVINPDMSISQVNGSAPVTPTTSVLIVDQWQYFTTQASKLTFQQVVDAPAGLKYSTKISVASQYAPLATDRFQFYQNIEGQNIIDFQLGTAGAVTIITSGWIKGSVAGTYSVSVCNYTGNRSYVGTVAVTNAWQRLTISFIGDTTGTWLTDTSGGFVIRFDLGCGTDFETTAGSWQAGNFLRTSGSVTLVNQTAGATLNITGVQVEKGITGQTAPTEFEFLPYETQLRRARRYYRASSYFVPATTAQNLGTIDMRTVPVIAGGGAGFTSTGTTADTLIAFQTTGAVQALTLNAAL